MHGVNPFLPLGLSPEETVRIFFIIGDEADFGNAFIRLSAKKCSKPSVGNLLIIHRQGQAGEVDEFLLELRPHSETRRREFFIAIQLGIILDIEQASIFFGRSR